MTPFSHLFHIAAHLALVTLQNFCRQLLISCVFRSKLPNFTLEDRTPVAITHPIQQDLLQGHLGGICFYGIFKNIPHIQRLV